jgi:hypothetical protein
MNTKIIHNKSCKHLVIEGFTIMQQHEDYMDALGYTHQLSLNTI